MKKFIKVTDYDGKIRVINTEHIISVVDNRSKKGRLYIETTSSTIFLDYPGGLETFLKDTSMIMDCIDVSFLIN